VAYTLSDEMEIIDLGLPWIQVSTATETV